VYMRKSMGVKEKECVNVCVCAYGPLREAIGVVCLCVYVCTCVRESVCVCMCVYVMFDV
jgi:hypothetical protein